ncbi:MAG TPA: alpha/beta hydrolase [Haliangiales bacterium]|nr:alpha/beta hydrolase [Haliangiales bacterium]
MTLEVVWTGEPAERALVFLHEGLGSVAGWREFPAAVSAATGLPAMSYSRRGYGGSEPYPGPWRPTFMEEEAALLPALLRAQGIARPILIGHSDGASIAIIHAATGGAAEKLALLAPHVLVEPLTEGEIGRFRAHTAEMAERLRRQHGDKTDALIDAWTGVWLSEAFRGWNIEPLLPSIRCATLVVQGTADPYGTGVHARSIERAVGAEVVWLPCGHHPHREAPAETLAAVARFVG